MELSSELLSQFAKVTKDDTKAPEVGVQVDGTAKLYNGKIYVQLDGSDQLTPVISSTAGMKDGDRVTVTIKDHTAKVTGNVSSPSAGQGDIDDAKQEIGNKITEVEILIADKVSTKEFDAEKARIDNLVADNVVIKDKLTATDAEIKNLTADNVTINQNLTAQNAEIENLKAKKLDVDIADIKYATVGNLEATNADIHNLKGDYGEFKKLTAGDIAAANAEIKRLDAEKASIKELDTKYANIDFGNIGEAAIKKLFTDSGIIKDLVVSQGHITGELVGVTIKGDLIEGGTVKADKLVVQGQDGLYYKLNVSGEKVSAQQTEYNSLNGSVITAKSITAEKVNVNDLVAFGATIGGFHIGSHALYSGVKSTIDNTTRGTYMNDDGEFAIGDQSNYLKFYRDTDGTYKLAISAKEIKMSSSNVSIETELDDMKTDVNDLKAEAIKTTQEQFYPSTSPTELVGGYWSSTQPTWTDGIYLWRRTLVTYISGDTAYTPSLKGVCITGNTGQAGGTGVGIASVADRFYLSSSNLELKDGSWVTVRPNWKQGWYIWTRYEITYTDGSTEQTYPVCVTGPTGNNGADGTGISDVDVVYAKSSSNTEPPSSGWQTVTPPWENGKYIWSKTITRYTDGNSVESAPVCISGSKGQTGDPGKDGVQGPQGRPGADGKDGVGITSVDVQYAKSSSNTQAPVSGWQTTAPAWEDGKYIWSKTVSSYTDGSHAESSPVCITGGKGSTGAPGADGKPGSAGSPGVGIKSIVEQYYQSTSPTTQTGGSWTSSYPVWVEGKYLWTRSVITYTDGNVKQTPAICVTGSKGQTGDPGKDGKPGANGVGVKSSAVTYQASASGTTIPTGNWVTTIPTVAAGQYLWTRTVITYTDNKTTTSYSVGKMGQNGSNGAPGADGKPGTDGVGIKSTSVKYQAGASQTTAPTGGWLDTVPKLSTATPYLWTKTVMTYTNGTSSTSYSVSSTLDGVVVGGRNLVRGTNQGAKRWGVSPGDGTMSAASEVFSDLNNVNGVKFTITKPSTNWNYVSFADDAFIDYLLQNIGETYTISFDFKTSFTGVLDVSVKDGDGRNAIISFGSHNLPVANKWTHVSRTAKSITATKSAQVIYFNTFELNQAGTATFKIANLKIEKGNKATDWTPAPEDVQQGIDNAQTDANNVNNKIDNEIAPSIEYAKSQIEVLNKSISSLVVDQNGGSLMTQTSNGWQFNIGAIQSALNGAIGDIQEVQGDISGVTELANKTNQLANDVAKKTAYINMTQDESGQPVMELGQQNGEFRLRITNTSMDFMQGSQRIAYLSNRQLYIQSSVVTDEMKIGATAGYIWKKRANGHMGLRYVSS